LGWVAQNQNWNEWGDTALLSLMVREQKSARLPFPASARFQSIVRLAEGLEKALGGPRELSWAEIAAQIICQRNQTKGRCVSCCFFCIRYAPLVLNGLSADSAACTSHVSPSLLSSGRGFASTPVRPRPRAHSSVRCRRRAARAAKNDFSAHLPRTCIAGMPRAARRPWRFFFTLSLSLSCSMAARKFMAIVVVAL